MSRPKLPRKSTSVDMTAMCDVAFLLLSFFILTTKFKPAEAIPIVTPNSVANKVAPDKDLVLVTIDKDGKVFLSMDNDQEKELIADAIIKTKKLNINVAQFKKAPFFGVSFSQLPSFLALPDDQKKSNLLPGIPCKDSANNELTEWLQLVVAAYANKGDKLHLLLKGDNDAQYPSFEQVIEAFKKNELFKFDMVTNPKSVPMGSDLWRQNEKTTGTKQG